MKYYEINEYIAHKLRSIFSAQSGSENTSVDEQRLAYFNGRDRNTVGAATLLLHPIIQKEVPWIVLEGAPGQGKSTITQYLCQVHRMRLFGAEEVKKQLPDAYKEAEGLNIIPKHHTTSHICLPFRIDLRDLASWLSGRNPFSAENETIAISNTSKALEEFLAFLVKHHSGGLDFSADE